MGIPRAIIVTTHPIQYQAPLFRALAQKIDLSVVFMMQQTAQGQAASGFGKEFEWDVPLLSGYHHVFANNVSAKPSTNERTGIVLLGHEQLLASLKPDVVITLGWFPRGYLQIIDWSRSNRVPLVCRGESNLVSSNYSLVSRVVKRAFFPHFFSKFSAFATIGKLNRALYGRYGVPEDKLVNAPYSIDTPFFESEFTRHRSSPRRPGPWRIGFSGKLIPKKRPVDLVKAVDRAALHERVQLVVVGDGPVREEMEGLARALRVNCEFRGFLNQSEIVRRGYADLDALVLPSGETETWGLVVNEAMTGGIPAVVSHKVGCAPDLVVEEETGYVFRSGDVAELAVCLTRLVDRLDSGVDFRPAVRTRIADYSMDKTVDGFCRAIEVALQ